MGTMTIVYGFGAVIHHFLPPTKCSVGCLLQQAHIMGMQRCLFLPGVSPGTAVQKYSHFFGTLPRGDNFGDLE